MWAKDAEELSNFLTIVVMGIGQLPKTNAPCGYVWSRTGCINRGTAGSRSYLANGANLASFQRVHRLVCTPPSFHTPVQYLVLVTMYSAAGFYLRDTVDP